MNYPQEKTSISNYIANYLKFNQKNKSFQSINERKLLLRKNEDLLF